MWPFNDSAYNLNKVDATSLDVLRVLDFGIEVISSKETIFIPFNSITGLVKKNNFIAIHNIDDKMVLYISSDKSDSYYDEIMKSLTKDHSQ